MKKLVLALLSIGAVLVVWQTIVSIGIVDAMLLPGPVAVLFETYHLFAYGSILPDIAATLSRTVEAFLIAAVAALPLGLVLGKSEKVYQSIEFLIDFFRSTPATALFPLFMLFFGIADGSKIAAAVFGAFFLILFNVAYGVMNSSKLRQISTKIMGASRWQTFKWVTFWESLPQTFVGFRSAISLSLVIVVVTEMFIGTAAGLGRRIVDAQLVFDIPQMYAAIIIVGILGYALNLAVQLIEKRYIHWGGRQ